MLFQDQEKLNQHLKIPKGCELKECDQADGVTSEVVEKLRCRKKAHKSQTEEDRWEEIYRLLFPDEIVPSPCKLQFSYWIVSGLYNITLIKYFESASIFIQVEIQQSFR